MSFQDIQSQSQRAAMRSLAQCAMRTKNCRGPARMSVAFVPAKCMICSVQTSSLYACDAHRVIICARCGDRADFGDGPSGNAKSFFGFSNTPFTPSSERAVADWPGPTGPFGFDPNPLAEAAPGSPPSTL